MTQGTAFSLCCLAEFLHIDSSSLSLQTTGLTSGIFLLHLLPHLLRRALPPHQMLKWRIEGKATFQRSLQVFFMGLLQPVRTLTLRTTSTAPRLESTALQKFRAVCCKLQNSASWLEEDLPRFSPGQEQEVSAHRRAPPAILKSLRWFTGPSSTPGSTKNRLDPRTVIRWIPPGAGLH